MPPPRGARDRGRHACVRRARARRCSQLLHEVLRSRAPTGPVRRHALAELRSAARPSSASSARAWPISSAPSISISCTGRASSSRRSRLDTAARERPTASAACCVGQVEFVDQALQRLRLFERVEVFALDVLDQRHREHGAVVGHLAHDRRDFVQAGELRRAPAALAGDDLVARRARRHASTRTTIGWITPCALIDSASSASFAWSMRVRGWYLPGCSASTGRWRSCRRRCASSTGCAAAPSGRAALPGRGRGRASSRRSRLASLLHPCDARFAGLRPICSRSRWRRSTSPARPR